jgi:23S rRNA (pseudouridine1915-N3)-methyltransferase
MTFVIGGHLGLAPEVLERADRTLSLSRMTLTHEMARLVAVEQIYRGLNILRGGRYHRP